MCLFSWGSDSHPYYDSAQDNFREKSLLNGLLKDTDSMCMSVPTKTVQPQ